MKKQTSINIFGAEQRLVFMGGATGDWGGGEASRSEKLTEGGVCYVPGTGDNIQAKGSRAIEQQEERLLQRAKEWGLQRIDEILKDNKVTGKFEQETKEAKAKIESATVSNRINMINETVENFETLIVVETDTSPLTIQRARSKAIRQIDAAIKAEPDAGKAALLAFDSVKAKAQVNAAKTPEDVAKIMEGFGSGAMVAESQKQEWTQDALQQVTQNITGIAPGGELIPQAAVEVAAVSAPGVQETKPESTDKGRVNITLGYINGERKEQHLNITRTGFKDYFGVSLKAKTNEDYEKIVAAIKSKQTELNTKGARLGRPDGILGPKTYAAIKKYDDAGFKKLAQGATVAAASQEEKLSDKEAKKTIKERAETIKKLEIAAADAVRLAAEKASEATVNLKTIDSINYKTNALAAIKAADEAQPQLDIVKNAHQIATAHFVNTKIDTEDMAGDLVKIKKSLKNTAEMVYAAQMAAKQATEQAAEKAEAWYKQALKQKSNPEAVRALLAEHNSWKQKVTEQTQRFTAAEKEKNDLQKPA